MADLGHEEIGGCRVRGYPGWRNGLEDARRPSAGMTRTSAVAALANGGGKMPIAMPAEGTLAEPGGEP